MAWAWDGLLRILFCSLVALSLLGHSNICCGQGNEELDVGLAEVESNKLAQEQFLEKLDSKFEQVEFYQSGFIKKIQLVGTALDNATTELIVGGLPKLEELTLLRCKLDGDSLAIIAKRLKLLNLSLVECQCEGQDFSVFKDSKLHGLGFQKTSLQPIQYQQIGQVSSLSRLLLSGSTVTDEDMVALGQLKELYYLDLTKTNVGNAGIANLGQMPRLTFPLLTRTKITDEILPLARRNIPRAFPYMPKGDDKIVDAQPIVDIPAENYPYSFTTMALSSDSKWLAIGRSSIPDDSDFGPVSVLESGTGRRIKLLEGKKELRGFPIPVAYSPDAKWLAACTVDRIHLWDVRKEPFEAFSIARQSTAESIDFSKDSQAVIVKSYSEERAFNVNDRTAIVDVHSLSRSDTDTAASYIVAAREGMNFSALGNIIIYSSDGQDVLSCIAAADDRAFALSKNQKFLAAFAGKAPKVSEYSTSAEDTASTAKDVAQSTRRLVVWKIEAGIPELVAQINPHPESLSSVHVAEDGSLLVCAGKRIQVWQLNSQ